MEATAGYEAPAVEYRTEVAAPLNTTLTGSITQVAPPTTPAWRRPQTD